MRKKCLLMGLLLLVTVACTHPIDIVGEGDIRSDSGSRDCLLEDLPCETVVLGEYSETYTAHPRSGHSFIGWDFCLAMNGQDCVFDIPADVVLQWWFQTAPPLVAKFAPVCDAAPADTFTAVQSEIFDGKGCSSSNCHGNNRPALGLNLSSGRSYDAIVNVTAQAGGGLKQVLPGSTSNSYLYRKVAAKTNPGSFPITGSPMPLSVSALSEDQLRALALWIDAGAPRSGRVDEFNEVERLLGLCD